MSKAKIYYIALDDFWRKEKKLEWIRDNPISAIAFERIEPDAKNNWINQTDNDWDSLLPLIDKDVKAGKSEVAVFKNFSYGFDTKRDDFVYSFDKEDLKSKVSFFIDEYNKFVKDNNYAHKYLIKWSRNLDRIAQRGTKIKFDKNEIITSEYRPYVKQNLYFDKNLISETFQWLNINQKSNKNLYIAFSGLAHVKPFQSLAVDMPHCGDLLEKTQSLPLYTFDSENQKHENITDWGLTQFQTNYKSANGAKITKQEIFYYTYAVLHSPVYRVKYEQNLKREFPRLPFYADFTKWRDWGERLMDLHVNYEIQEPFALERKDLDSTPKRKTKTPNLFDDCLKDNDSIASGANPTTGVKNDTVPERDELPTVNSSLSEKEISSDAPDGFHPSLLNSSVSPTKIGGNAKFLTNISNDEAFIVKPQTKLRADRESGAILIDSITTLSGVPPLAWEYKLGNRSALEWILDQYKEKKPTDATIAERFNTYKFEDYKEQTIDLLMRVCAVSVRTMEIVNQMPKAE